MGRRRTPVITTADNGSKFVGEFSREPGRPKQKPKPGRPRTETQRDLMAYLLWRVGMGWEEIAERCGFDSLDPTAVEVLQQGAKRLNRRIIAEHPDFGICLPRD